MNELLFRYGAVCRLIAELFPDQIEVVLHDAGSGTIAAIEGVYSNRKIGDKSLIDIDSLDHDESDDGLIGPYPQLNWDGEQLRSYTAVLSNDNHETIGFLCVNCRTSTFAAAARLLSTFSNVANNSQPKALFKNDWRESVNRLISTSLTESGTNLINATRKEKVEVIHSLDQSGLLEYRGSPEYVAQSLGMSRASFYNLLKDSRLENSVG